MRLLALDLDGTAVNDDGRFLKESREAVLAARKAGWLVCFVTGRRDIDMLPILGDALLTDYVLLNNGGKIIRTADGKVLENRMVNPTDALTLIEASLVNGWHLRAIRGVDLWVTEINDKEKRYAAESGRTPRLITSPRDVPWDDVEGFSVMGRCDEVLDYITREGLNLEAVMSGTNYMDIMQEGVHKWSGIVRLSRLLRRPLKRTICVGNYDNDIVMIENADIGVAVGSARGRVKDVADYVTHADHNQSAVAEVVRRFILSPTA